MTKRIFLVALFLIAAACSPKAGPQSSSKTPDASPTATAPASPSESPNVTAPVAPGKNKWLPLTPGYQAVSEGRVTRGRRQLPHRRVYTVTDVYKQIDGLHTVVILDQDFDGGEIAEQALDFLAEDEQGNVLYVGSYTESYEGGQFVNASDAWLSGVKGGRRGMLMPADPRPGTPKFVLATIPGEGSDTARVLKIGESKCVPFKCFSDLVVIEEAGSEWKFYAAGVGQVLLEPHYPGGEQEVEELVNFTQLSPQGLSEIAAEVLKLDSHARTEAKDVFGNSAAAQRGP